MTTTIARVASRPVPLRVIPWVTVALDMSALWRRRRQDRRRILAFDDRLLHDIGMTRADALREGAKPFWRR